MIAGYYVIHSSLFDYADATDSGAVSIGRELVGPISTANSIYGYGPNGGSGLRIAFNTVSNQLIVGQTIVNAVSILGIEIPDQIFTNGFEKFPDLIRFLTGVTRLRTAC